VEPLLGISYVYYPLYSVIGYFLDVEDYKYVSLAQRFKIEYKTTTGYAFSPVSESYLNFLWVGPLIVGFLFGVGLIISSTFLENTPFYPLILLSGFVFTRGDFVGTFQEVGLPFILILIFLLTFARRRESVGNY